MIAYQPSPKKENAMLHQRTRLTLAVIALRDKGVTVRFDNPAQALTNAGKVVSELQCNLLDWHKSDHDVSLAGRSHAHATQEVEDGADCKSIVVPMSDNGHQWFNRMMEHAG